MPAFRQYLFSPETNKWLDVMIWSSAQPHSVNDMVDKCFGGEKEKLVAVWARDTLGLSSDQYSTTIKFYFIAWRNSGSHFDSFARMMKTRKCKH